MYTCVGVLNMVHKLTNHACPNFIALLMIVFINYENSK